MQIEGWRYYNHAALPTTPPDAPVNMEPVEDGTIWKIDKGCYLARWISNYDCLEKTNWWYVIKDSTFDINQLKSKRRSEINKGKRNYYIKEIDAATFKDDIFLVQKEAYSEYPSKYRPTIDREALNREIDNWTQYRVFGAFSNASNSFDGYALLKINGRCIEYLVHKVKPDAERLGINAALVNGILDAFNEYLSGGFYLCDGSRNISHETHFQDYLEKYFGFRKAYCVLHIKYSARIRLIVLALYPFRRMTYTLDNFAVFHKINGILRMEEIARS